MDDGWGGGPGYASIFIIFSWKLLSDGQGYWTLFYIDTSVYNCPLYEPLTTVMPYTSQSNEYEKKVWTLKSLLFC
jgi:hypothetical protein